MNDRIDLEPLADWQREVRGQRVERHVMRAVSAASAPRPDLLAAILLLGRPALAVAAGLTLIALAAVPPSAERQVSAITIGSALGVPVSAERIIRGERPVDAREMLAILGTLE